MNKKKLNKVISAVTMSAALLAVGPASYKGGTNIVVQRKTAYAEYHKIPPTGLSYWWNAY